MQAAYSATMKERIDNFSTMVGSTNAQYGQQPDIRELFDQIVSLSDSPERTALIEQLLDNMENNREQNGFFGRTDDIRLVVNDNSTSPCEIRIDDIDLYKMFFDNYSKLKSKYPDRSVGALHSASIKTTVSEYFGKFNGDSAARLRLTRASTILTDDMYQTTGASVAKLRNKGLAMCTERASVSHNLWLIGGFESYYIEASSIKFNNSPDQAHAYCLVSTNDTFKMFDPARDVYLAFEPGRNVPEEILNGQPLKVDNNGITEFYANAQNQNLTQ